MASVAEKEEDEHSDLRFEYYPQRDDGEDGVRIEVDDAEDRPSPSPETKADAPGGGSVGDEEEEADPEAKAKAKELKKLEGRINRLKRKLKEKTRRVKEKAKEATMAIVEGYEKGTGFLYAFKGIWFFIFNPSLWFVVFCPLACSSFFSILCITLLLFFALPGQAHLLFNVIEAAWFPMWLAWLISVALVLLESAVIVMFLTQLFFNCYKAMLEERVFRIKGVVMGDESTIAVACSNVIAQALFAWIVMAITIPLNLIPVIGNLIFFMLSGTLFAWSLHAGYFSAKDVTFGQQAKFVSDHWFDYMSFGAICLALNMAPIINFLFIFTNMVGAAIWAADLEKLNALEPYILAQAVEAEKAHWKKKQLRRRRLKHAQKLRKVRRSRLLAESSDSEASFKPEDTSSSSSDSSDETEDDTKSKRNTKAPAKIIVTDPPKPKATPPKTVVPSAPPRPTHLSSTSTTTTTTTTTSPLSFPIMPLVSSPKPGYEEIHDGVPSDLPPSERQRLLSASIGSPSVKSSSNA